MVEDESNEVEKLEELDEFEELLIYLSQTPRVEKTNAEDFIKNHTHIRYCEAIIDKDGMIGYVRPSHVNALIGETGLTKDEVYKIMPMDAHPLYWLVERTGCISIWFNFGVGPSDITKEQRETIDKLINSKVVSSEFYLRKIK